jgi:hypothetical protein
LVAPAVFGLLQAETRAPLLRFVADLRRLTLVAGQHVSIDFSGTEKMYADGTLLFAAELDEILRHFRRRRSRRPVDCNYPRNNVVEQVLQHLGLLQDLGLDPRVEISADDVRNWQMYSGESATGALAEPLVAQYGRLFHGKDPKKLYDGLVEAMTNCMQHAYLRERRATTGGPQKPRWWMFAEQRDGKLSVAFCDLGIGINRSLMHSAVWPREQVIAALSVLGRRTDDKYIKAAMELGRSRMKQKHRGGGLRDLREVIESAGAGHLLIFSNRGLYLYRDGTEILRSYADSILGTLISWQIPLPAES